LSIQAKTGGRVGNPHVAEPTRMLKKEIHA
jgi:hypothetical protein